MLGPRIMTVTVMEEAGYAPAMYGLSLSYLQPLANMPSVALKMLKLGEPHCKFLRQIKLWLKITAPWYWWKHMATYNIGLHWDNVPDFQSTSTMHKIMSYPLGQMDFSMQIDSTVLNIVNQYIVDKDFENTIAHLPGAYLYTRVLCTNYSALREIIKQRSGHKLVEWQMFISQIMEHVEHPLFLEP
ncbi:hypothetical protein KKH23_08775 [Patescibacteria group bacterium]|nr:hypothetical protein [Patescibacteria group bacterium]MBU0847259.1 hypothetical protein [Patescibacteria group bacterium]